MTHRRTVSAVVAGTLLLTAWAARGADRGIAWRGDYDKARKEAVDKGRPLFLSFHTEDCFHCRRLEAGPFKAPGAAALGTDGSAPCTWTPASRRGWPRPCASRPTRP